MLFLKLEREKKEKDGMSTPHPFRFGVTLLGAASRHEWIAKVHKVEDLGYAVLQVPDHLGNQFSPTLALMAAAEASRTLRLGTLVLDINYRHLALLAKEVATLDLLSEGRFELGLGAGWIARESQMMGIPFDPAGRRVSRLEEAVQVLKGLFSDGPMTFAGRSYSLNGFEVFPKPFQHPHPPLLLSGGGKRMLSIAGRVASIITLNPPVAPDGNSIDMAEATADATAQQIAWIREAAGDRFAHIEIDATAALAGLEHFSREYFVFRPRLLDGISASQRTREPIQIQVDAVATQAAQLRGGVHVHFARVRDVREFGRFET